MTPKTQPIVVRSFLVGLHLLLKLNGTFRHQNWMYKFMLRRSCLCQHIQLTQMLQRYFLILFFHLSCFHSLKGLCLCFLFVSCCLVFFSYNPEQNMMAEIHLQKCLPPKKKKNRNRSIHSALWPPPATPSLLLTETFYSPVDCWQCGKRKSTDPPPECWSHVVTFNGLSVFTFQ